MKKRNKWSRTGTERQSPMDQMLEKLGGSGGYGRSAKLQSGKSGANLAGNARRKVPREDITSPSGYGGKGTGTKADPNFIQKQKQKDTASEKRVKKEQAKEKTSSKEKRAKRDKELEGKIGKKGLKEAQKAYKGLYGNWM
jgi:Ca2+-dependent lipid-binding protein